MNYDFSKLEREVQHTNLARLAGLAAPDSPIPTLRLIPAMIDHTVLRPDTTPENVEAACAEAMEYHFGAICVSTRYAALAARVVGQSDVHVAAVVSFPHGSSATTAKCCEAESAIRDGASELDVVAPIGLLCAELWREAAEDISAVVAVGHAGHALVKVILETCFLAPEQQAAGCLLARAAGADMVKTSTGFGPHGAKEADVRRMKAIVGDAMGIKASGGIRTWQEARRMIQAGATRIGASQSVAIWLECQAEAALGAGKLA
jgi:deoxyribose-phosphate aldolase